MAPVVDYSSGKLALTLPLVSIVGPGDFGEVIGINYSTTALMRDVKTWNTDSQTGIVGLGWSLTIPSITRLGTGSIDDRFFLGNTLLLPKSRTGDSRQGYVVEFETARYSLNKISYRSATETWTVVDGNGITYQYGGEPSAIQHGVRWIAQDADSPAVWIGSSRDPANQQQYVLAWNLASKTDIYGRRVDYQYDKVSRHLGQDGKGKDYTVACYPSSIRIKNGASLRLSYRDKEPWEYPLAREAYNNNPHSDSAGTTTSAYQDRIESRYLSSVLVYDTAGILQSVVELEYGSLWEHFDLSQNSSRADRPAVDKRILRGLVTRSPDGLPVEPSQKFDYWGYGDGTADNDNDGFASYYGTTLQLLKIRNQDLDGSSFGLAPYQDARGNTYYQLFGHLKSVTTALGATTWYSYREVSKNYASVQWPAGDDFDWSKQWKNRLDLPDEIGYPDGKSRAQSAWENPRPYWGPDGYVVLRWDSKSDNKIWVDLYEWLGSWRKITYWANNDFCIYSVAGFTDKDVVITTEHGLFAVVRANKDSGYGVVSLIARDVNVPGRWTQSYFLSSSGSNRITLGSTTHREVQVGLSDYFASVLDRVNGRLYVFVRGADDRWSPYTAAPIVIGFGEDKANSCMQVVGDELFVIGADSHDTVSCWLFHHDLLRGFQQDLSAWRWANHGMGDDGPGGSRLYDVQEIHLSANDSFGIMVGTVKFTLHGGGTRTYLRALVISWPESRDSVRIQKVLTQGQLGEEYTWGIVASLTTAFGYQESTPSYVLPSNLINVTSSDIKQTYRFIGSDKPGEAGMIGWNWRGFSNLGDNSDSWAIQAMYDTTVATKSGSGHQYGYEFYQYDPLRGEWKTQSVNLGQQTDWTAIIKNWELGIQIASLAMMVAAPVGEMLGSLGEAAAQLVETTEAEAAVNLAGRSLPQAVVLALRETFGASAVERILGNAGVKAALGGLSQGFAALDFIVNGDQSFVYGTLADNVLQAGLSGRRAAEVMGRNYLFVGRGQPLIFKLNEPQSHYDDNQPLLYSCQWSASEQKVVWKQVDGLDPMPGVDDPWPRSAGDEAKAVRFVGQDVLQYSDYFVPFSYLLALEISNYSEIPLFRGLFFDQVAFFRNGAVLGSAIFPCWSSPGGLSSFPVKSLPYTIYTGGDGDSRPLLYAPWGGLLAYRPPLQLVSVTTENTVYEGEGPPYFSNAIGKVNKLSFAHAEGLKLCAVKDEAVEGPIKDWVVDKVVVDDGYQAFCTHYQYMPSYAAYDRTSGSVGYNQVRVASGAGTYSASAAQYGWTENYLYPGGPVDTGNPADPEITLPYDPANGSTLFSADDTQLTNVRRYYGQVAGQSYCTRVLKSNGQSGDAVGIEVDRTYTFYKVFSRPVRGSPAPPAHVPRTIGVLPTLTITAEGPTTAAAESLEQGPHSLSKTYTYYDIEGFYGPANPNTPSPGLPYSTALETGLPLATLTFDRTLVDPGNVQIEGIYTQSLLGVRLRQAGADYDRFLALNLYSSTVGKTTWYRRGFQEMSGAWPQVVSGWQVIAAEVTTWRDFTPGTPGGWHPETPYRWKGGAEGNPQGEPILPEGFPWGNPHGPDFHSTWVRGDSVSRIQGGVVLAQSAPLGATSTVLYDRYLVRPIAHFRCPTELAMGPLSMGFEPYEDLTGWQLSAATGQAPPQPISMSFCARSYTGTRSLSLRAEGQAAGTFVLQVPLPAAIDLRSETRDWLFSLTYASADPFDWTVLLNGQPQRRHFTQGVQSWRVDTVIVPMKSIATLSSLGLEIRTRAAAGAVWIDHLWFSPLHESSIAVDSYDSCGRGLVSVASGADPDFLARSIMDARRRAVGSVRRDEAPPRASRIKLQGQHFSRDTAGGAFDSSGPNSMFTIEAQGTLDLASLKSTAGSFFDLRDEGAQGWQGGRVRDRLLIVENGHTATYPVPAHASEFGIRVQMQAFVQRYSTSLPQGSVGQPAPQPAAPDDLVGAYTPGGSAPQGWQYIALYTVSAQGTLSTYSRVSVEGTVPVVSESGDFLVAASQELAFCCIQQNATLGAPYKVYALFRDRAQELFGRLLGPVHPPLLIHHQTLYFADRENALYALDISRVGSPQTVCFAAKEVLSYSTIGVGMVCAARPAVGGDAEIALLLSTASAVRLVKYSARIDALVHAPSLSGISAARPPVLDERGNAFFLDDGGKIHAYDPLLREVATYPLPDQPAGNLVAGDGRVAVALTSGDLLLLDTSLALIGSVRVDDTIAGAPAVHGDKISVLGRRDAQAAWHVYTHDVAGLLAAPPYALGTGDPPALQAFSGQSSALGVTTGQTVVSRIQRGIPSASIALAGAQVDWASATNTYTLSIQGQTAPPPVSVASEQGGDWLLAILHDTIYFFADGQPIFAEPVTGSFPLQGAQFKLGAAGGDVGCSDIVLFENPGIQVNYTDGTGKMRQTQALAEVFPPTLEGATVDPTRAPECRVLIQELLYDSLARQAFNTVLVAKGAGAQNPRSFAFEPGFVTGRDPASGASVWAGGKLAGQITTWVDRARFGTDVDYLYSGTFFEPDALSRTVQSTSPGVQFHKDTPHAPQLQDGSLPDAAAAVLRAQLGLTAGDLSGALHGAALRVSEGSLGDILSASLTSPGGATLAEIVMSGSSSGEFLLSGDATRVGAADEGLGRPVMARRTTRFPNFYSPAVAGHERFVVQTLSDALGQPLSTCWPDSGAVTFHGHGRRRFSQNADQGDAGVVLYSLYDRLGRITELGFFRGAWDPDHFARIGGAKRAEAPPGSTVLRRFYYDTDPDTGKWQSNQGRLVQVESWNSAFVGEIAADRASLAGATRLEGSYLRETTICTPLGEVIVHKLASDTETFTTRYAYTANGKPAVMNYPRTGRVVIYSYYRQGGVKSIGSVADLTAYAAYVYNVDGTPHLVSQGASAQTTLYEYKGAMGQITRLSHPSMQLDLAYQNPADPSQYQDGNVQSASLTYSPSGQPKSHQYDYSYDIFGRLRAAAVADPNHVWQNRWDTDDLQYDANGNRLRARIGGSDGAVTYSYRYTAGTNQLAGLSCAAAAATAGPWIYAPGGATFMDGLAGRIFSYDLLHTSPVAVRNVSEHPVEIVYDARGERHRKRCGDQAVRYLRGLGPWPLVESQGGGPAQAVTEYIYGPTGLVMLCNPQGNFVVLKDQLGSTRMVLADAASLTVAAYFNYDAFGNLQEGNCGGPLAAQIRYRYTGQEWDPELGLYNYHARQYDPILGRFLTPDPAHQFPSPYVYCGNNPSNATDPTGGISFTGLMWTIGLLRGALWGTVLGAGVGLAAGLGASRSRNTGATVGAAVGGFLTGFLVGLGISVVRTINFGREIDAVQHVGGAKYPVIIYDMHQMTLGMETGRAGAEMTAASRGIPRSHWDAHLIPYDVAQHAITQAVPVGTRTNEVIFVMHGASDGSFRLGRTQQGRFSAEMARDVFQPRDGVRSIDINSVAFIDFSVCYQARGVGGFPNGFAESGAHVGHTITLRAPYAPCGPGIGPFTGIYSPGPGNIPFILDNALILGLGIYRSSTEIGGANAAIWRTMTWTR